MPRTRPAYAPEFPREAVELYGHGPDELDSGAANMSLRPVLGKQNLLLLDGAEHLRRRKLVLPPFHGERTGAGGPHLDRP